MIRGVILSEKFQARQQLWKPVCCYAIALQKLNVVGISLSILVELIGSKASSA